MCEMGEENMGCRYVVGGINADAKLLLHWTMVITATRMVSMVGSMDSGDVFDISNYKSVV